MKPNDYTQKTMDGLVFHRDSRQNKGQANFSMSLTMNVNADSKMVLGDVRQCQCDIYIYIDI